jgi:hypothetical protein
MRWFWLLLGIATVVTAAEPSFHRLPSVPDRPAELTARWRQDPYRVVRLHGLRATVEVNGKRREADRESRLSLNVAGHYAPGFVTVVNARTQGWEVEHFIDGVSAGPPQPGWSHFAADLSADRDLEDVFVALVVFESDAVNTDDPPRLAVLGVPVGRLKQGVKRRVSSVLPALNSQRQVSFAALVFCRQGQVRSSGPEQMVSRFFDRVERHTLQQTINQRILARVDAPLQVLRLLPIRLSDELTERYRGRTVRARLQVGIDGSVQGVEMIQRDERELQRELEPQLRNWLFVPPMKDGLIVRQQVVLPLEL